MKKKILKNTFVHGAHCPVRSPFMYLIAKAKGRTTHTCCRAGGQTLLTLLKEDMTVVAGYHGGPCVCICESLMKAKPPVQIYHHLQKYF